MPECTKEAVNHNGEAEACDIIFVWVLAEQDPTQPRVSMARVDSTEPIHLSRGLFVHEVAGKMLSNGEAGVEFTERLVDYTLASTVRDNWEETWQNSPSLTATSPLSSSHFATLWS